MKFLVDAQLPYAVKNIFENLGYDTKHTDDLPDKERTTDNQIREISRIENRIVITKDTDFVDSHHIKGIPSKLLLVSTGNIKNKYLYNLITKHSGQIISLFSEYNLIEIDNTDLIAHG